MPLYEFACSTCKETVEILVGRPDETVRCPKCDGERLEKQLSRIASPSVGQEMPIARQEPQMGCGAPRCCGGVCHE